MYISVLTNFVVVKVRLPNFTGNQANLLSLSYHTAILAPFLPGSKNYLPFFTAPELQSSILLPSLVLMCKQVSLKHEKERNDNFFVFN